jgi:hypothetical protein
VAPVVDGGGLWLGGLHLAAVRRYLDARPDDRDGSAVGTLVRLGELYWSAWGRLLTELASTVATRPDTVGEGHDIRTPRR